MYCQYIIYIFGFFYYIAIKRHCHDPLVIHYPAPPMRVPSPCISPFGADGHKKFQKIFPGAEKGPPPRRRSPCFGRIRPYLSLFPDDGVLDKRRQIVHPVHLAVKKALKFCPGVLGKEVQVQGIGLVPEQVLMQAMGEPELSAVGL